MQKVREEDSNLYFNAKSAWRWCEFSAHPRVMVYADRTGAELTDIRVRHKVVGNMVVVLVMWFSFVLLKYARPSLKKTSSRWEDMLL